MKIALALLTVLLPTFASAADYSLSCGVSKQKTQGDYAVSATVKGTISGDAEEGFTLSDYRVTYTVYSDAEATEVWTDEVVTGNSLDNDPKYRPTKYKKHVKFAIPSKRGGVDFIYPGNLGNKKKFQAHVVFSYIDDHFGGTAHVYCSKTAQ